MGHTERLGSQAPLRRARQSPRGSSPVPPPCSGPIHPTDRQLVPPSRGTCTSRRGKAVSRPSGWSGNPDAPPPSSRSRSLLRDGGTIPARERNMSAERPPSRSSSAMVPRSGSERAVRIVPTIRHLSLDAQSGPQRRRGLSGRWLGLVVPARRRGLSSVSASWTTSSKRRRRTWGLRRSAWPSTASTAPSAPSATWSRPSTSRCLGDLGFGIERRAGDSDSLSLHQIPNRGPTPKSRPAGLPRRKAAGTSSPLYAPPPTARPPPHRPRPPLPAAPRSPSVSRRSPSSRPPVAHRRRRTRSPGPSSRQSAASPGVPAIDSSARRSVSSEPLMAATARTVPLAGHKHRMDSASHHLSGPLPAGARSRIAHGMGLARDGRRLQRAQTLAAAVTSMRASRDE